MLIDFEERVVTEQNIVCILPGQVHFPGGNTGVCGWFLAVDSVIVKEEYKEIFEKFALSRSNIKVDQPTLSNLNACISIIHQRLISDQKKIHQFIVLDLLSAYIGMIAEACQKELPASIHNRLATITHNFKIHLSANYRLLKHPAQYAAELNISPAYLYEAVKQTTGQSVSNHIRNEIITQAKRLLFYTRISIKEIAQQLGYEDYVYFTRLFTRTTGLSPTQFRKKHLE